MGKFKRGELIIIALVIMVIVVLGVSFERKAIAASSDLFISEYIEGTSYNKALEIYNGTGADIDLSAYSIKMYFNGNSNAGNTINLIGTIADGDVFVVAHANADAVIISQADLLSNSSWYNGNDAVVLMHGAVNIDIVGVIGVDPGTSWSSGTMSTRNQTLRRKGTVTDGTMSFDLSAQWESSPEDTFSYLGSHSLTSYIVTFQNDDGTVLSTQSVDHGNGATAPADPTKPPTAQYTYTFNGWDVAFDNITGPLTVTATYTSTVNNYPVSFENDDGTVLSTQSVAYGSGATAPADPTKPPTAQYTYTFAGWDVAFNNITRPLTVTATYTSTVNNYPVSFENDDGTVLSTQSVAYGSGATAPADPTKPPTAQYTYTFNGWDVTFDNITGPLTVTATYTSTEIINTGSSRVIRVVTTKEPTTTTNTTKIGGSNVAFIDSEIVDALINKAKYVDGDNEGDFIEVEIINPSYFDELSVHLSDSDLDRIISKTDAGLSLKSRIFSIKIDKKVLESIADSESDGGVEFTFTKTETDNSLPCGQPAFKFDVMKGENKISDFVGKYKLNIPYDLKDGEDVDTVLVYSPDAKGDMVPVRGFYDSKTNSVIVTQEHPTRVTICHKPVQYSDIAPDAWYKDAVEFVSARNIIPSVALGKFDPDAEITRSQFVAAIMKGFQVTPFNSQQMADIQNFDDVKDNVYSEYLHTAKVMGIVKGVGGNRFDPDRTITRQEVFVVLYNLLDAIDELPTGEEGVSIDDFDDTHQVSSWAKNEISVLISGRIVNGSDGKILPLELTSISHAAQLIYNLLTK